MDVNDVSNLLYKCRFCEKVSRSPDEIKDHITHSGDPDHRGKRADTLEGPAYITLNPDVDEKPFDEWKDAVAEHSRVRSADEGDRVCVTAVADDVDLPTGFVYRALRDLNFVPVDANNARVPESKYSTRWKDLTDSQQDTLLAVAYFPDKYQREIADMPFSGHRTQSEVSTVLRNHEWLLSHPDAGCPIAPQPDNGHEGKVETDVDVETGLEALGLDKRDEVPDAEPAVADANHNDDGLPPDEDGKQFYEWLVRHVGRRAAEALYLAGYESKNDLRDAAINELQEVPHVGDALSQRIKVVLSDGPAASAAAEESTGEEQSGASDDEVEESVDMEEAREQWGGTPTEAEESALPATTPGGHAPETGEDDLLYAPLGKERAWDAIKALIETGREEAAREVFEAVASGPIDLSPIEEDE